MTGESGSVAAFVALVMVALLGFAALVIDIGVLYENRRELQNAADAAALAGAQEFKLNPANITATALDYASRNGVPAGQVASVQVMRINGSGVDNGVQVTTRRAVNLLFAPVLGRNVNDVAARATAVIAPVEPIKVWPFGVPQRLASESGQIVLKYAAPGSAYPGNFGLLDLMGSGARSVRDFIRTGYNGPVPGPIPPRTWQQDTQTGNEANQLTTVEELLDAPTCAYPGPDLRCPTYGLVPIVTDASLDACIGKCTLTIFRFAIFRVEGFRQIFGGDGHIEIIGRWVEWAWALNHSQNVGGPLTGPLAVRLWE